MKINRGEIIPKILEILQEQAETTVNLLDIVTSGYGESYRKMRRSIKYGPPRFREDWATLYRERQQFYSLLNQLKNQGFIAKRKVTGKNESIWRITRRGLGKLSLVKERNIFSKKKANYRKESDNKVKVVIFDVPEKQRHKRVWLRFALISLGFSLLQQSVWIGKSRVPEGFLHDLREREMLPYVHIFEISKSGTITQLH